MTHGINLQEQMS